jgi:hypothetical protein
MTLAKQSNHAKDINLLYAYSCAELSLRCLSTKKHVYITLAEKVAYKLVDLWLKDETNTSIDRLSDDLVRLCEKESYDILDLSAKDILYKLI